MRMTPPCDPSARSSLSRKADDGLWNDGPKATLGVYRIEEWADV